MARVETWVGCDLDKAVQVRQLGGFLFTQDNEGNLLGAKVTQDGEPVNLTGTVVGYAILADGQTVDITGDSTGIQNGNEAYIILPQLAYSVPGQISIVIKLTTADTITTLAAFCGYVYRSKTGNEVVPPGTPIPDLSTLEEAIRNANTAATAANTAAAAAENVDISMSQDGDVITITTTDRQGETKTATLTDQSEAVSELKSAIILNNFRYMLSDCLKKMLWTVPEGAGLVDAVETALSIKSVAIGTSYVFTTFDGEYIDKNNGKILTDNTWCRTNYIPCKNATSIEFNGNGNTFTTSRYGAFYTKNMEFISNIPVTLNDSTTSVTVSVPNNAEVFAISYAKKQKSNLSSIIPR